jgi:hypothetical protein
MPFEGSYYVIVVGDEVAQVSEQELADEEPPPPAGGCLNRTFPRNMPKTAGGCPAAFDETW